MEKNIRLRSNRDYKKVYQRGKIVRNRNFTLIYKKYIGTRIGFSVTKKYGNAVERNRIKRILREIVRLNFQNFDKGYDVIIIPKQNTKNLEYTILEKSLKHAFHIAFKGKKK